MSKYFLQIILTLCFFSLYAEENVQKQNPFVVDIHYSAGKVAPIYPNFPKSVFANGVEVFLGYQTYGSQRWHKLFNYPRMGLSFIYQDLGNREVLGQQFSIVPTVYFSTAKKENAKFYAEFRYGLGIACFTTPYDDVDNRHNNGAGSIVTWQYTVGANMNWKVDKRINVQLGAVWYHASNAHTQLPNVGVNNFAVYFGLLAYPFGKFKRTHEKDSIGIDKKWHLNLRFGSGWHEMGNAFGPVGGKKYPVYTASVYTTRRLAKAITAKMGFIYRYYPMYQTVLEQHKVYDSKLVLRSSAFIVFLGADFLLGHFAISLEAGINVYKPAFVSFHKYYEKPNKIDFYTKQYLATRFGLNYYVRDPYLHPRNNVFVGAYVCANSGQAEFLELNLGYVW
ncbi:MAG: acyloxyacyl hydrolase [Bacteroidetes bacterium]|nr:acyloxyacyl hydrolase [Bacteroidota bacterium]